VLECSENTTLDDFGNGILVNDDQDDFFANRNGRLKDEVRATIPNFTPNIYNLY
jgi:hypothetical protein